MIKAKSSWFKLFVFKAVTSQYCCFRQFHFFVKMSYITIDRAGWLDSMFVILNSCAGTTCAVSVIMAFLKAAFCR